MLIELTGSAKRIVHLPLPQDDPRRRKPNIARAREMLKWHPTVSLEDGLEKTIAWFREELTDYAKPLLATAAE